jgi:transposase-like protein
MARREYSDEIKAQVMAALLAGQSVSAVAREYSLPKGTVSSWRKAAVEKSLAGRVENSATQKGQEIGDLVLGYLRENLITLKAQAVHFRDPKWLSRQDASELAVLHGVVTDKAIRLLEAIDAGNE